MTDTINKGRRQFLIAASSAVGAVGAGFAATPFLGSWNPSAKAKSAGAPITVNISKIEPGAMVVEEWRREPIFIVRRTPESLGLLKEVPGDELKDPNSDVLEQQPDYARNDVRSRSPEILVLKGVCTHLGCAPKLYSAQDSYEPGWPGGFFCPCHGSKFDLAGRVYSSAPAGKNLPVPPHQFDGDMLTVGIDEESA